MATKSWLSYQNDPGYDRYHYFRKYVKCPYCDRTCRHLTRHIRKQHKEESRRHG
jgi:hypothetical protein